MPPSHNAATIELDGRSLSIADVVAVARRRASVAIAAGALQGVAASRAAVEAAIARGETIYGVNTGFGKLADVRIPHDELRELQLNLVRSHACGIGPPLSEPEVRAMMLLRANVLTLGLSGIRAAGPAGADRRDAESRRAPRRPVAGQCRRVR